MQVSPSASVWFLCLPLAAFSPGEPRAPQAGASVVAVSGAVDAAELVLMSLRNWSATEPTGASWIEASEPDGQRTSAVSGVIGGAPPVVHVGALEVRLHEPKGLLAAYFAVELDLQIVSADGAVVAATMLEDFLAKFDELNGALGVGFDSTRLTADAEALSVSKLVIELPIPEPTAAPTNLSRPLTEIVRRVAIPGIQTGDLRIQPRECHPRRGTVERFIDLRLVGEHARLPAAACGALLRSLGQRDGPLQVTRLSLSKGPKDDPDTAGWRLSATVRVGSEQL